MGRFTEVLNESFRSGATPTTPNTGAIATVGSMAITNASIAVDISVADYVSVTQSGAYLTVLGSVNVNNNTAGSVVYMPAGSVIVTNNPNGSVYQLTNPWIVLGSVQTTNPPYLGSTFTVSGLQDIVGSVAVTNQVNSQYFPSATSTKFVGIPMAVSGLASGTPFSGISISDGARYLKNITVYGGIANDDLLYAILSGTYVASGVPGLSGASHSFEFDTPMSWTSGAILQVNVTNNTAKTSSVNSVVKYLV